MYPTSFGPLISRSDSTYLLVKMLAKAGKNLIVYQQTIATATSQETPVPNQLSQIDVANEVQVRRSL
jgi:hypothetical protein